MDKPATKTVKDQQQRSDVAGWDNEGGAAASDRAVTSDTPQKESGDGAAQRAFDSSHHSSTRGEHRYPDAHQTEAEQNARRDRDDLKRKLGHTR
jgi:hypothetical protein